MPMYRWADLEEVPLNPLITGRVVEVPNAMLAGIAALSERHRGKSANDLMREAIFTPLADLNR